MKRRSFVRHATVTGVAVATAPNLVGDLVAGSTVGGSPALEGSPALVGLGERADLVLRGGMVFDGTGASPRALDVVITGDRITAMTSDAPAGGKSSMLPGSPSLRASSTCTPTRT